MVNRTPNVQKRVQGGQGDVSEAYEKPRNQHFATAKANRNAKLKQTPSPDKPQINTTKLYEQSSANLSTAGRHSQINAGKQESDWKRQLIEHDIRLQNAKLQMIEL